MMKIEYVKMSKSFFESIYHLEGLDKLELDREAESLRDFYVTSHEQEVDAEIIHRWIEHCDDEYDDVHDIEYAWTIKDAKRSVMDEIYDRYYAMLCDQYEEYKEYKNK